MDQLRPGPSCWSSAIPPRVLTGSPVLYQSLDSFAPAALGLMIEALLYPAEIDPWRNSRLPVQRVLGLAHGQQGTYDLREATKVEVLPLWEMASDRLGLGTWRAVV